VALDVAPRVSGHGIAGGDIGGERLYESSSITG
jgi:hypothetical protein